MKIVITVIILLIAGAAAYFMFVDPDALNRMRGQTAAPAQTTTAPANPSPAPSTKSKPAPVKADPAKLEIPNEGEFFVNGEPVKPGTIEVPAGELVITSYRDGQYHHQVAQVKAGGALTAKPQWRTMNGGTSWDSFQGGPQRTGYSAAKDRTTLKKSWSEELGDKVQSSPIILDTTAYFSADNSLLTAVDLQNGAKLWADSESGSEISPIANSAYVFAGNGIGEFGGYRLKDGKRKGETQVGSSPSSLTLVSEEAFLAVTRSHQVFSIKTKKGFTGRLPLKVNWQIDLPELGDSTASPVILDDKAVFQTDKGDLIAISINDGSRIWPKTGAAADDSAPVGDMSISFMDASDFLTPTPAAQGDTIYAVANKKLIAVNAADGSQRWSRDLNYKTSSSLSCANGLIYLGSADGKVYAHSTVNGAQAFSASVGDKPVFASPVLFKDKLLVAGGDGVIKLLNSFTGEVLAENRDLAGSPIQSTPAVSDRFIFAINKKGRMICFE